MGGSWGAWAPLVWSAPMGQDCWAWCDVHWIPTACRGEPPAGRTHWAALWPQGHPQTHALQRFHQAVLCAQHWMRTSGRCCLPLVAEKSQGLPAMKLRKPLHCCCLAWVEEGGQGPPASMPRKPESRRDCALWPEGLAPGDRSARYSLDGPSAPGSHRRSPHAGFEIGILGCDQESQMLAGVPVAADGTCREHHCLLIPRLAGHSCACSKAERVHSGRMLKRCLPFHVWYPGHDFIAPHSAP